MDIRDWISFNCRFAQAAPASPGQPQPNYQPFWDSLDSSDWNVTYSINDLGKEEIDTISPSSRSEPIYVGTGSYQSDEVMVIEAEGPVYMPPDVLAAEGSVEQALRKDWIDTKNKPEMLNGNLANEGLVEGKIFDEAFRDFIPSGHEREGSEITVTDLNIDVSPGSAPDWYNVKARIVVNGTFVLPPDDF